MELPEVCAWIGIALALIGLLGNGLSTRIMASIHMAPYSTAIFLLALSISDTIVLVIEAADDVAEVTPGKTTDWFLYGHNDWRCRITTFLYESARVVSSWVIVAMAVELALVGGNSQRSKSVYVQERAAYVVMAICLVSLAANFPFLVITKAEKNTCSSKYNLFFDTYKDPVINVVVNSITPLCFVIVCTARYFISHGLTRNGTISSSEEEILAQEQYVKPQFSKPIILITLVFALSTLPNLAMDIMDVILKHEPTYKFSVSDEARADMTLVCKVIFLVNYCVKFYICITFEPSCGSAIHNIFKFGRMANKTKYSSDSFNMPSANPVRSQYMATNRSWRRQSASEAKI